MVATERSPDVIVIGGGVAGLAAATFLARQGARIHLLERSHTLGGRAQSKNQEGFCFNIGPHALYRGGCGRRILKELGIEPRGGMPSPSGGFAVKDGVKHTLPAGLLSLLVTGLFGPTAKLEVARLLGSIGKIDARAVMGITARAWVDREITHTAVRDLVLALFRLSTYAHAPEQLSAGVALAQLQMAMRHNVLYLDGGWQTLVDGLRAAAERAGVTLETDAKVEAIERNQAGAVAAVRLASGARYDISTVIIAAGPSEAAALVAGARPSSLQSWAEQAQPVKAACLDLALGRLPNPKATFALGIDAPLYFSVHSAVARLAPAGGALIHVAQYLSPQSRAEPGPIEQTLEGLLDLVQPGWRAVLVQRRFLPEMTVYHALPTAARQGTRGRPGPEVPDVPGLFVAGDWVGPEGLLVDAALASAKQAAQQILARAGRPGLSATLA